jgi:hypothetical protein
MAVDPEEITRMLREKSDENVNDSGESDEEKELITRSPHVSESEKEFFNSEDSDSDSSEENENASSDNYFTGRDI